MPRSIIATANAPKAIGTYSQAVKVGSTVYVSGQIPLDPATGELVQGPMEVQVRRVFDNLKAIVGAAGGSFCAGREGHRLHPRLRRLRRRSTKSWPSTSASRIRRA